MILRHTDGHKSLHFSVHVGGGKEEKKENTVVGKSIRDFIMSNVVGAMDKESKRSKVMGYHDYREGVILSWLPGKTPLGLG